MRGSGGWWFAIALAVAGCSSSPAGQAPCPATVPVAGASCTPVDPYGRACEYAYGSADQHDCTTAAFCGSGGAWVVNSPAFPTCGGTPAACPATSADLQEGAPCDDPSMLCEYADKVCECQTCYGPNQKMGHIVHCRSRSDVAPGCPALRPLLGTPCTAEGLDCDYEQCCSIYLGEEMVCADGYWRSGPGCQGGNACAFPACPPEPRPGQAPPPAFDR